MLLHPQCLAAAAAAAAAVPAACVLHRAGPEDEHLLPVIKHNTSITCFESSHSTQNQTIYVLMISSLLLRYIQQYIFPVSSIH